MTDPWDLYGRPEWDDRKQLADLWQQHAPLPDIGLREGIYDALLAIADWGYERGRAANDPEPDLHDAAHPKEIA